MAIRDFERGAHASIAVGLGTLLLAAVFHHDFHELPEKAYQAFGVVGASFPESFKGTALTLWWVVLGGFAMCAFLTWVESGAKRKAFDPSTYAGVLRALREAYDGGLALVYFAVTAGAVLAGLIDQDANSCINRFSEAAKGLLEFVFRLLAVCDVAGYTHNADCPLIFVSD